MLCDFLDFRAFYLETEKYADKKEEKKRSRKTDRRAHKRDRVQAMNRKTKA